MLLRNRVTGQVHDVPDHLVHGFHTAQEVDGFGEPLGFPFLAALAPMLTNLLPSVLPAIGSLFTGGHSAPAPAPPPPPPAAAAPVVMSPPPPPAPEEMPPEPMPPRRSMNRGPAPGPDDDMPPPRGADPMGPGGPPSAPGRGYRVRRRVRRRGRRVPPPQVHGYGWWY